MKRKILVLGNGNPRNIGGVESFCRTLDSWFEGEVTFFSIYSEPQKESYNVSRVYTALKRNIIGKVLNKFFSSFILSYKINHILSKDNFSHIVLNSPRFLRYIPESYKNITLVQHMSCDDWFKKNVHFDSSTELLEEVIKRCKIVLLSEGEKDKFCQRFGVSDDIVSVIPNTCNLTIRKKAPSVPCRRLVMLCRLENSIKRIDLAIDLMNRLPNYKLDIYGEGPDRESLINRVHEFNLLNVNFKGSTNDIESALDNSLALLMLSDTECFPVSCVEALFRGVPIVARDTFPSARSLVNQAGVMLDKNEHNLYAAVKEVERNYQVYSTLALEQAVLYTPEKVKEKWLEVLS